MISTKYTTARLQSPTYAHYINNPHAKQPAPKNEISVGCFHFYFDDFFFFFKLYTHACLWFGFIWNHVKCICLYVCAWVCSRPNKRKWYRTVGWWVGFRFLEAIIRLDFSILRVHFTMSANNYLKWFSLMELIQSDCQLPTTHTWILRTKSNEFYARDIIVYINRETTVNGNAKGVNSVKFLFIFIPHILFTILSNCSP